MDSQVAPLAAIYELNTDLLLNCLEGLTDHEARRNHPLANPMARYLADAGGIQDVTEWPTVDEVRSAWLATGAHLAAVLADLTHSPAASGW
jgi:hypothetical protein